ncbi:MAG: 4Fe-4S dicluster domain-containing protein, partial [Syntrophales bacterium]
MDKPKKVKKPRGRASLIPNRCIACGARCQAACPVDAIEMNEKGEPIIIADKCIGCRKCVDICPALALEMFFTPEEREILKRLDEEKGIGAPVEEEDKEEAKLQEFLAQYRGVWVFVEQTD